MQVGPILGAGGVLGGGPAPQNGLLSTTVAQVPALFPHLHQHTPTPAPRATDICAKSPLFLPLYAKRHFLSSPVHALRTSCMPGFPASSRNPQAIDNQELPPNSPLGDSAGISRKLLRINNLRCEILVAMEESQNHDYSLSLHSDDQRRLSGNTIIFYEKFFGSAG